MGRRDTNRKVRQETTADFAGFLDPFSDGTRDADRQQARHAASPTTSSRPRTTPPPLPRDA